MSSTTTLSWVDRPMAELINQAWPITISMLSYSAMTLVDTLFVGRLGASALAGVGLGGVVAFALLVFAIGLLRGVKVLVSQAVGAGRRAEASDYLSAGLAIALGAGVITALVGQLVAALLPSLAGSAEAGKLAGVYLGIRILGAPLMLTYVALREARYGLGDTRSPMRATVAANLVNFALAWLLVGHLGAGVAGVAWATVVAHAVEAGVLLLQLRGECIPRPRLAAKPLAAAWRMGWPNGLQMLIEVGSFAMLSLLIAAMAEAEMAGHQIALQVIHVSFLPALAIGEAASVLAGQAVGAARDALVGTVARLALGLAALYTAMCTVIVLCFAPLLVRAFTADPAVAAVAVTLLHVSALFQVSDAANIVARCVLRGTGDVRFPAVVGIAIAWGALPPLTWLLGHRLGLGAMGGWIGILVEISLATAVFWWRLERGGWRPAAARARAELARSMP